uniref:ABC transporter channel subunit n=1 Tax=Meteora sporadica TaxID=2913902 RepID=UPI0030019D62|nr:ABC transporter channel subunit [Meteora sporadica]
MVSNAFRIYRKDIFIGSIYIIGNIIIFSFSLSYINLQSQDLSHLYLIYFSLYYILLFLYNITISIKIFEVDLSSGILDTLYIQTSSKFIVFYKVIINLLILNTINLISYPFIFFFYNIYLEEMIQFFYLFLVNNLYIMSIVLLNILILIILSIKSLNNILVYAVSIPLYLPLLISISNLCISVVERQVYLELAYFFILYNTFFLAIIFYLSNLLIKTD